jgi:hypothetical protein
MPRVLSITAPGNNSGKTKLAETILRAFPDHFTVIKISTVYRDGRNCPKTESACACHELHGQFSIITDPHVIDEEGTDTGRLARAGAARTLWCLTIPGAHGDLWRRLRSEVVRDEEALLTEGNRIVGVASPSVLVFVASPRLPRARWKEDAWSLMARADLVIVNDEEESGPEEGRRSPRKQGEAGADRRASRSPGEASVRLAGEIGERITGRVIIQDVSAPLKTWNDPRMERLAGDLVRRSSSGDRAGTVPASPSGS